MKWLDEAIAARIGVSSVDWGICAQSEKLLVAHQADRPFPAASVNKLAIVLAVADMGYGQLSEDLTVTEEQKRPGTGILRHFPEGYQISIFDALRLMLMVSDNTAAKLVVDRFGADQVNSYLRSLGCEVTQLELEGNKFTYGKTTPREMAFLLGILSRRQDSWLYDALVRSMRRCRFPYGIRRHLDQKSPRLFALRDRLLHKNLKWRSKLGLSLKSQLREVFYGPESPLVANKEGSLEYVRNEVALVMSKPPYRVAILSEGQYDGRYSHNNAGVLTIAGIASDIHRAMTET